MALSLLSAGCGNDPGSSSGEAGLVAPEQTSATAATTNTSAAGTATAEGIETMAYFGHFEPLVLAQYPHDETSFTQGLEWFDSRLLESAGLVGHSNLRLVNPRTGEIEQLLAVDDQLFAEGVTVVNNQAYQLTWQDETLLITDLPDLSSEATQRIDGAYRGEGWGLCFDGVELVMSDGTDQLTFRHAQTFEVERQVNVILEGTPVPLLNELECVGGQIWANIWHSNTIVAINSLTGEVEATIDATSLVPAGLADTSSDVLNGIAFNHDTGTFWLTGKRWPLLYEVELVAVDLP